MTNFMFSEPGQTFFLVSEMGYFCHPSWGRDEREGEGRKERQIGRCTDSQLSLSDIAECSNSAVVDGGA